MQTSSMRILLLEDESNAEELLRRILGPFAARIDATGMLETGKLWARSHDYDVVVLDLRLADSDREATINAIPELKRMARAPVVVLSGWPDPELKERVLAEGAEAFVQKKDTTVVLLVALQHAVEHNPDKLRSSTFPEHVALLERMINVA